MMAEDTRASARIGPDPDGTVTRWLAVPSLPLTVLMKVVKFAVFMSYK